MFFFSKLKNNMKCWPVPQASGRGLLVWYHQKLDSFFKQRLPTTKYSASGADCASPFLVQGVRAQMELNMGGGVHEVSSQACRAMALIRVGGCVVHCLWLRVQWWWVLIIVSIKRRRMKKVSFLFSHLPKFFITVLFVISAIWNEMSKIRKVSK